LARSPSLSGPLPLSGTWDAASIAAAQQFQESQNMTASGNVDAATAALLLKMFNADGVRDQGLSARQLGYMFKLVISVHGNRSVEAPATLFDADNKPLLAFIVRTHGHRDNDPTIPWPDFGDGDVGLNQFSSNGATVTGMIEVDLNTPEPDPKLYGPYPVTRLVRGLKGNAQFLMPNIRDGLLLHTGNWYGAPRFALVLFCVFILLILINHSSCRPTWCRSVPGHPWDPSQTMPNSDGCIHGHPNDIKAVAEMLQVLQTCCAHGTPLVSF
jgi:hypothetical protein